MTKKDYVLIAATIASLEPWDLSKEALAERFADALQVGNPRFNRDRFIDAAKATQ